MTKSYTEFRGAEILIVDDQPANLGVLVPALEQKGFQLSIAQSGPEAIDIATGAKTDLILLDIIMPGLDGFETCRRLKQDEATQDIPVIFITAKGETQSVTKGFDVGGIDYIQKPFQIEEVLARVETHLKINRLTQELSHKNNKLTHALEQLQMEMAQREQAEKAREQAEAARQTTDEQLSLITQREAQRWGIEGFIGHSRTIAKILRDVNRLQATGTVSVLIQGESGTGKELIARAIHFGSSRAKRPFIAVNCSAVPKELAESEFFGHAKGAFTGAATARKGYFELADGGTLFLDEIGDMALEIQAKLLRVLENGVVTPIGATYDKKVDVRVLAATNIDLQTKIVNGAFRNDLYFRLAQFPVTVPPLRDRREDIPMLAAHFLSLYSAELGLDLPVLSGEALTSLAAYAFPGNVRELKNIIVRAMIESEGEIITPEHLYFVDFPVAIAASTPQLDTSNPLPLALPPKQAEAQIVAYVKANGYINNAACRKFLNLGQSKKDIDHVSRFLKKMCKVNLLKQEGEGKGTYYCLP